MFRPLTSSQRTADLVIGVAAVPVFLVVPLLLSSLPPLLVVAALLAAGAIAVHRLAPPIALAATTVAVVLQAVAGTGLSVLDVAVLVAVFSAGADRDRIVRWCGLAVAVLGGPAAVVLSDSTELLWFSNQPAPTFVSENLLIILAVTGGPLLLAWGAGMVRAARGTGVASGFDADPAPGLLRRLTPVERTVDLSIAAAFLVVFLLLFARDSGSQLVVVTVCAFSAALGLRRWSPAFALGLAWVGAIAQMLALSEPSILDAAIPPVVYACAAYGGRAIRWATFASSLVGGGVAGVYVGRFSFDSAIRGSLQSLGSAVSEFAVVGALTAVTLLLAWTLGVLVATARRSRRNRQEADAAGEQVVAEQERTRIARDMHDVVAHSLAVVIAQSDGARLLRRTDPEAVDEALETIGAVSRAALADVRVLLQQLRYEGTTSVQPGLADLDALLAQFRGSGLDVQVQRDADLGALSTSTQLAAFRIVQESLTNALRHGDLAQPASVHLGRGAHGLELEVVNGIDPARSSRQASGGHGLIGMRERAGAVQGELTAGEEAGAFRVRAFLPSSATAAIPILRPAPEGSVA